ncbi:cation:proton antiporter [Chryseobacterium indoltheticum]|uniref:Potassium/proton antiporter n=1 Tax=Chryseobacterium indoltheticum TaxID=254 RepID=A0A381FQR6_9FLAO|nr:cation:proton antiporter [Chryseobacterium indoltheticum]SUX48708.1 potassium/proton antiporter [Chryseobacterium indoltheticum]
MDQYLLVIVILGAAILSVAWMPGISKKTGISYSIFYVAVGFILYRTLSDFLPDPMPQKNENMTLHLTELIVIISLMGTGIKIDRKFSFKRWSSPLKLVGFTMLLCIGTAAAMGYYFLGLGIASAVLLGAVLAPTDPVLASDVQVGPPNDGMKSEAKFSLTAEAGLNDGVAFPFTWLAITVGLIMSGKEGSFIEWFAFDVIYRIAAGIITGFLTGKGLGILLFKLSKNYETLKTRDGLVAVAATLLVYGVTEFAHGYGFIAVFICAITLRHFEKEHHYHDKLHSFTDQIERLLLCLLLIIFGGTLAMGVLDPITGKMVLFAGVFLLIIRPVFGWLALASVKIKNRERLAIGFFGIRGMGSIFYLAFAFSKFDFDHHDELWAVVSLTILFSILIHGLTATPVMENLKEE